MFSMCSELTPRAPIPDTRIPQLMQPWHQRSVIHFESTYHFDQRGRQFLTVFNNNILNLLSSSTFPRLRLNSPEI